MSPVSTCLGRQVIGHFVPEARSHGQDAKPVVGHAVVDPADLVSIERCELSFREHVDGLFEHDVDAALREGHVPPGPAVDRRHALALRVEGDLGHAGVLLLEIGLEKPVLFGNPVEGDFRWIPTDPDDIIVGIRKRIIAEGQRLQEVVEPTDLGVIALEQRPVGEDLLDGHAVHREGPRLVGADGCDGPQCLHGRQLPDQGIVLDHLARPQGKRDGDDGGQGLGDGGHGKRNGREEHQHGGLAPQEPHAEDEGADEKNGHGELLAENDEAPLEGGLALPFLLEHGGDLAELRAHPRADDDTGAPAVGHDGALEGHVRAVPQGKHLPGKRAGVLLHGDRLTREGRLLDFEPCRLGQPHIGRDDSPRLQKHQVPRDYLRAGDGRDTAVAKYPGGGGGHLFQGLHGLLGAVLLDETDHRIEDDDDEDGDGVGQLADEARDDGGSDQHQDHEIPELVKELGQLRSLPLLCQFVAAVFRESIAGFFRSKAVDGNFQFGEDRLELFLVPVHASPQPLVTPTRSGPPPSSSLYRNGRRSVADDTHGSGKRPLHLAATGKSRRNSQKSLIICDNSDIV